ncbi:ASCH domain-containing protein [Candidatus Thiosymbion oneisti]|uniref:ASCH domain-containing protein n=1 Tax=Candidatus Thiosymbion oneisti TaxID=589554 RepID=UPI000B7CFE8B
MSPVPVENQALWLSVRPAFAQLIIDGHKKVELRRVRPRAPQGTLTVLYATSPIQSIIGMFILDRVEQDEPRSFWERNRLLCGIEAEDFNAYFKDVARAVGLHIGETWKLEDSISLASIRSVWPGFSPPRSFRYLQCSWGNKSIALALPDNSVKPLLLGGYILRE